MEWGDYSAAADAMVNHRYSHSSNQLEIEKPSTKPLDFSVEATIDGLGASVCVYENDLLFTTGLDENYLTEDSSELSDILGVALFFNDGDSGYYRAMSRADVAYTNPVPIPGAVWLFSTALLSMAAGLGFRKKNG